MGPLEEVRNRVQGSQRGVGEGERGLAVTQADNRNVGGERSSRR